jgi:light-regulated signal transduction histidine kinase (bacteriophytochrome)
MRHKDGHWIWINDRGKTISWTEEGKPLLVFGTHIDITERKHAEEALKLQARERAAVDTFTYSVSNDLQAPLRRIEGFSEALLEECSDQLNDQARDYLNRIVTQIGSMKKLTDALLQLSKVVSREIDREEVDLSALTLSYLDKLQYEEPERQLDLVVTPGLITEGDPELLNMMLAKLLDNAWKFSASKKEARIEFGNTKQDERTVYYLKDNGVGFDMNHAEKLFAPFHKLHSENEYPGIGIGLNLVYRIISRHGGDIWAEGEEGNGACFFFTLP